MSAILLIFMAMLTSLSVDGMAINEVVSFTLVNSSEGDISLKFPGQAVTTIKARSQTKVNLNKGAKIFFFDKKKKYLLMTVKNEHLSKNIIIDKLIVKRKEALGLE